MTGVRRRKGVPAALALLVLLQALSACNLGNRDLDEATRLNQSAGQDIAEIERLVRENKEKESEVTRALNRDDFAAARSAMDEALAAIDRGLERGESAASKFERASKLDIDSTVKEYLGWRAQSVAKAIEAFRELRKGVVSYRDSVGGADRAANDRARGEIQRVSARFDQLISEFTRLERRADEIARRNPDKIKPGS
jgi:uncharacterized protein Yka (UPF0111/DUF47 family)